MTLKRADKFSVVSVTASNAEEAKKLSQQLLEAKLCACVQIIPNVSSMYWWEGKITKAEESLMIIKTHQSKIRDLLASIEHSHSYDVPEVIEMKPAQGSSKYLDWVLKSIDF